MVLRLELRLLFSSKNIYEVSGKVKLCYSHVLAGICSPISTDDSPAGGSFPSGSRVKRGSHSGKVL